MKNIILIVLSLFINDLVFCQDTKFSTSPEDAKFVTSDLKNFWIAFDSIGVSKTNPFNNYIAKGTKGLKGFIPNRIKSADALLEKVIKNRVAYEKMRNIEKVIKETEKETKPYFYALEYWYPYTVYPPTYFVFGRFNSGGTISSDGLIIGAEKLTDIEGLPYLIIHESIHFQQKESEATSLLANSILEGSADFIAELVTGYLGNKQAYIYGNVHKDELCAEFVTIMNEDNFDNWLYGTTNKDDRPNDLGYWIGYEITKAYFNRMKDKKLAINHILNIENFNEFLRKSEYLNEYLQ